MTTLIISKRGDEGAVRLGALVFDEANNAKLVIDSPGPDADALQKDWQKLSSAKELNWKFVEMKEIDGETVSTIDGREVSPGEDDYRWAVQDNLEREYGYTVDVSPE